LNSGVNLPTKSIKQKVVLQALADVWVRYRCDERPNMRFVLKQGRTLVLRGEKQVVLQLSNPEAVNIRSNTRGSKIAQADTTLKIVGETSTLGYPPEAVDLAAKLFANDKALPKTPTPSPKP
jgi:hypothetical protein